LLGLKIKNRKMNFFQNIFGAKKEFAAFDYSAVGTDIHSHFIPGLDDGSKSIEDSVEMVKAMMTLGYKKIITTPHVQSDFYKNTKEQILAGCKLVNEALLSNNIDFKIEAAAEYFVDYDFEKKVKNHELLTLSEKFVLIELSSMFPPDNLKSLVFDMSVEGYKVILAHPERYSYWHNKLDVFEDLKTRGVFFQTNIISLSGFYSPQVRKAARQLIDESFVDFVGTDMHNLSTIKILKQALNDNYFVKLVTSGRLMNSML